MQTKTSRRSFAGGEITPEMYGRVDNIKNQTGLGICRNAIVLPHGPVTKRPGLAYVLHAKDSANAVRVIPFVFSATQSMILEFGNGYLRFKTQGASLLETAKNITGITQANPGVVTSVGHGFTNGGWGFLAAIGGMTELNGRFVIFAGVTANTFQLTDLNGVAINTTAMAAYTAGGTVARVYTVVTPYVSADLFKIKFTQDSDVLTLVHPSYPTYELRRLGATNWTLTAPALGSSLTAPTTPTATPTAGTGTAYPKNYYYKITTISADGLEESLPVGPTAAASVDLTLPGSKNAIAWAAPGGVTTPSYRIYKSANDSAALYGYIGETTGITFTDDNILPDYSRNPPSSVIRLDTANNYPSAVTYYEQRRVFAATLNSPQGVFMTRTGTESNLSISNPQQSSDAIQFKIKAQQQNAIRHLLPLNDLLALTAGGVWRVFSNTDQALLPATVAARPQSYDGVSDVTPLLTGSAVVFTEANGKRIRDIGYSNEARSYVTDDRSIMAVHLFDDYTILDASFAKTPGKLAWFVRSDGGWLSMTYVPEHQVFAWAQHFTDGVVESVATVPENGLDFTYFVVRRVLAGQTVRVIERMASRQFATQADAFFVDCGATYGGAATATISGLWHLEGKTVRALADGAVVRDLVVANGRITLPVTASTVHIGLPFTTDIETLPLAVDAAAAAGQGTIKNISYAYLLVYRTGVMSAGPDFDTLTEIQARTNEPYDSPPRLKSEEIDVLISPDWTSTGSMCVRSDDPVPFTLSAITMQVSLGG